MQLFEFEGKQLFKNVGINIPQSQLIDGPDQIRIKPPLVLKVQILSGKRADAGGIIKVQSAEGLVQSLKKLFESTINGERVEKILVEEAVEIDKEYYLSFSYSTETRGPVMTFGSGGTGAEQKGAKSYPIDLAHLEGVKAHLRGGIIPEELVDTAIKLWEVFIKYDLELAEINPLVVDKHGQVWALDSKVILDDDADFRREIKFPERNLFGRAPTQREIEARKIDEGDHRGTAGSVYWDLDGDIAVIAAGGGGSIVNMDALLALGGKPANYTEHSGNPPGEKLKKLTKIVLSKPGLKGCWFVGGTANFTDIYETLMGFAEGLREIKPKPTYPIVIRRGGPQDKKAFEALEEIGKKEGFDFHIFGRETPMTSTAKIMVELAYGNISH
ncbi:MAG: ATP citrate lyase citrate-binding domain-containing protein [Candidatus Daviesbacteria bacterium]|nr:ATP citrate lyase citrate-binding domain-containing protein [Candidatus Daviesbacteria bacterium]